MLYNTYHMRSIELHKPAGVGKERSFKGRYQLLNRVVVGGHEGYKYLSAIYRRQPEPKNLNHPLMNLFIKELRFDNLFKAKRFAKEYSRLYRQGFPVPPTVRFFEEEGRAYLAMTDMTYGGQYLIWGYNDASVPQENANLAAMKLSPEMIADVSDQALEIARHAGKCKHIFPWYSYHVRQHILTREVNVILLDIYPEDLNLDTPYCESTGDAEQFVDFLTTRVEAINKGHVNIRLSR